jgi:hypothetical protein
VSQQLRHHHLSVPLLLWLEVRMLLVLLLTSSGAGPATLRPNFTHMLLDQLPQLFRGEL